MKKIFILALLVSSAVAQNNYFVSPSGSDSGSGTSGSPWATFAKAIASFTLASPGGAIIHFANGTYVGSNTSCFAGHTGFCVNRGPTNAQASQPLVIQCDNGLNGNQGNPSGTPASKCLLRNATDVSTDQYTSIMTIAGVDYVTVQGFDIGGDGGHPANFAHSGFFINAKDGNGNFVKINGNYLHDAVGSASDEGNGEGTGCPPEGGIIINAGNPATAGRQSHGNQFNGNFLNKLGAYLSLGCNQFHGMYIGGAVAFQSYNNIIGNVPGSGIKVYANVCSDNVSDNVIFHAGWWGILVADTGAGGCAAEGLSLGHATINNNILVQNGLNRACGGIAEGAGSGVNKYTNNLFIGNAPNDQVDTVASGGTCTATTPGGVSGTINGTTTTATLVNYQSDGTGDYHLKTGSLAIAAGSTACASGGISPCVPSVDFANAPRSTQDDGAYVFTAGVAPPTNVTATVN